MAQTWHAAAIFDYAACATLWLPSTYRHTQNYSVTDLER